MAKRILKPENLLSEVLLEDEAFKLGIAVNELSADLPPQIWQLVRAGVDFHPPIVGTNTRINREGRLVRRQPEEKEEIRKRIHYTRKNDGVVIDYIRTFYVYVKDRGPIYDFVIKFDVNEDGEQLLYLEDFIYERDDHTLDRVKVAMNVLLECFGQFEILRPDLSYAIAHDEDLHHVILPSGDGAITEESTREMLDSVARILPEAESRAFRDRFATISRYSPSHIVRGLQGYNGYLVFEFQDRDFVIAESLRSGNATYIFPRVNYRASILLDKQTVLRNHLHRGRFRHSDNWERSIHSLFR